MKRNLIVRIVAIVLCAIMVLSVVTVAITAFAAETTLAASPETGSNNIYIWVIAAVVVAVAAIISCVVLPKTKK